MSCPKEGPEQRAEADSQEETEALSQTVRKDLNPANNRVSFEVDRSPVELLDKISAPADTLIATLQRTQLTCARTPDL